jgi:rare lipoprotein A (peptidoglycan hydrolase)
MKKAIIIIALGLFTSSFAPMNSAENLHTCTATWYDTQHHPKVHRNYSTAAFNHYTRGTKLLVTNVANGKSDTVEITDRHGCGSQHIDLSKTSFGKLAQHGVGRIKVVVKKLI